MSKRLDSTDRRLLDIIQREFPLNREPFAILGRRFDVSGDETMRRIRNLKALGIIRLIGPIFNPEQLGYRTTLVAMKVPSQSLDRAAKVLSANALVSHCYEREHDLNLWFTLAAPAARSMDADIQQLADKVGAKLALNLPAIKVFKIGAFFSPGRSGAPVLDNDANDSRPLNDNPHLTRSQRAVINELQQDLPVIERPFDKMSAGLKIDVDRFLSIGRDLLQRRIMRRFSAAVSHRKLGFEANAMACWTVPANLIDAVGKQVAANTEVSHCYERKSSDHWPYNLFAMIHADTRKTCRAIADRISLEADLDNNRAILLYSTRELIKARVKYPV